MSNAAAPVVSVLSLGGTIAMTARAGDSGVSPALEAEDVISGIPELADGGITVRAHSFRAKPSPSLDFGDLAALTARIDEEVRNGAAGIVITQGTDTMEETAFFLDVTVTTPVPIVVTGAMRNPTMAGADGPANVLAAIRLAASPVGRDLGCVVVMADEIHAARYVRKTHTTTIAAFTSPDAGPLGTVIEGRPRILTRPGPRTSVPPATELSAVRVPVIPMALGEDGANLHRMTDDADGVVIAGFGAGHVPESLAEPLGQLATRIPVVLASRTGAGPILTHTYGFPGSEQDLRARGLLDAGFLDPYKARVLLCLLVADGTSTMDIQGTFNEINRGAVPSGP